MNPIARRKRALLFSCILVVLVGVMVAAGLAFKRSRAAAGATDQAASQG